MRDYRKLTLYMQQLNDSMQARYTVMRGGKNIRDLGRVTAINDGPLKVYKQNKKCNVINGTDFMYFPPFQRKEHILWGYSDAACKSFPLRYKYKKTVLGVRTTYKYMHLSDPLVGTLNRIVFFFATVEDTYHTLAGPHMRM